VPALADLLTGQLLRELVARGASGGPLTPLADQLNHDLTHLQGQQHNASLARLADDLQAALATLHRLDQRAGSIPATRTPARGRPVHELTDPFALEVHRAIDVPGRTAPLSILPAYIERDHDRQLRAIVKQAADGRSAAAVLIGGSSTGKTRACWEAVQALPHDWRLWHPIDPSRPEAAADALSTVGPRTVIWLNEAQHYLLTPTSELGERIAAGLRELLRDPTRGPVLLLGTIWPDDWATLTVPPPANQQDDPHAQARMLLTGLDIVVPDAFTGPGLQAARAAATADPRLAEAAKHAEDGRITQFLAGAPALLERYRNAPIAAKALLEAAMDARRLGHGLYLPHDLLEEAATGYLTDQQWDALGEKWLKQALAYCAAPCRGAPRPLTRVRPRPGQPTSAQPRYRLADYLDQAGRATRRTILAPAALWNALVEGTDVRDLLRIGEGAERRSLYRYAFLMYQRARDAGDRDALRRMIRLLRKAGRVEEAISMYQHAAETGDPLAQRGAAELLREAGRVDEAIGMYQRAAETGSRDALRQAVRLLREVGRVDEAIGMYQHAAETGDPYALEQAAQLLREAGRRDEAISWLQTHAAKFGHSGALRQAAELLEEAGRRDEAIGMYQHAAETGDSDALRRAAELLEEAGRHDEVARLRRYGLEPGGHVAHEWQGSL
jgi:tetratricopeptide (TPR) repeat protein